MSSNWNRRYRANMGKLKTGDIYEVAEVVKICQSETRKRAYPLVSGES